MSFSGSHENLFDGKYPRASQLPALAAVRASSSLNTMLPRLRSTGDWLSSNPAGRLGGGCHAAYRSCLRGRRARPGRVDLGGAASSAGGRELTGPACTGIHAAGAGSLSAASATAVPSYAQQAAEPSLGRYRRSSCEADAPRCKAKASPRRAITSQSEERAPSTYRFEAGQSASFSQDDPPMPRHELSADHAAQELPHADEARDRRRGQEACVEGAQSQVA